MLVLLYSIADVKRFASMDMFKVFAHIERYAVHNLSRCIVDKLKLDVLKMLSYELACSEIEYTARAEHRFLIAGAEWIELTQQSQEFGRYLGKRKVSVDIELRRQLRRKRARNSGMFSSFIDSPTA